MERIVLSGLQKLKSLVPKHGKKKVKHYSGKYEPVPTFSNWLQALSTEGV